jgi:CSLREA domain-containing protein
MAWGMAAAAGFAAPGQNIIVDTLDDELILDGDCSLREAITAANDNAAMDACPAGGATDVITFAVSGTIALVEMLPQIDGVGPLTIDGGGLVTVSGDGTFQLLLVYSTDLNLDGLTFAGGLGAPNAGAVHNAGGTVTVANSTFTGNHAIAFGGAIMNANFGSLTVTDSTFSDNSAAFWGGAIAVINGNASIANSTFAGNQTTSTEDEGDGAAIVNFTYLQITNSTFSGNEAVGHGGALRNSGVATVSHSTFSGNSAAEGGGALYQLNGATILRNTILANSAAGGDCLIGATGIVANDGGNLVEDGSCGFPVGGDPLLGPLADNGGPTLTHLPLEGSPAVDTAAEAHCLPADQRGVARPQDGDGDGEALCDIGSVEREGEDEPIAGLMAANNSPTLLGATTTLTATVTAGTNVSYTWAFGDGETGTGSVTTHVYPAAGLYTAVVTATNAISSQTAETEVTVVMPETPAYLYLPAVMAP